MEPSLRSALAYGAAVVLLLAGGSAARATVEMQKEARKAGFQVTNCLYCHASKHAAQVMKAKARQLNMNDGNCLLCHGYRDTGGAQRAGRVAGVSDQANLDEGLMWPTSFALTELTAAEEARIGALVKKAVS